MKRHVVEHLVRHDDELVLAYAMTRKPEPIEWDETTTTVAAVPEEAPVEEEASTLTAH